jgi:L-threonylcarbamoyladenylate synthase
MAASTDAQVAQAVRILRDGGLVAFPTETVYGLGADADNPVAVRKIFAAKGRPADHPLIVHLASAQSLPEWTRAPPEAAHRLAERFWPGPLTLILRRGPGVLGEITGGQDTVGLRVPAHPVAQALLQAFDGGIAAPSANRFGRVSPTTAQHVREELGDRVQLVLDGGRCEVGIESTILDLSSGAPVLLRPGHIGVPDIEALLGVPVARPGIGSPRVPGALEAHYAPGLPLHLVPTPLLEQEVREQSRRAPVAVLARRPRPRSTPAALWMVAPVDAVEFARHLYAGLRQLEHSGCKLILVEAPPQTPDWNAVRDRLTRAAAGSGAPAGPAEAT